MIYRAVGDRCAVDVDSLQVPLSSGEIIAWLKKKEFRILDIDLMGLARGCIGNSRYRRGASILEAPAVVDCSSFTKWLYAQCGIWLPRRSIQQRDRGEPVELSHVIAGDLIFVSGWINYYHHDPADGVGHVGIVTERGTVIHAANHRVGIVESPLEAFVGNDEFRGARRYVPKTKEVLTVQAPHDRLVEISDDIRWMILQSLEGVG
jgi:NlpC/P60 family